MRPWRLGGPEQAGGTASQRTGIVLAERTDPFVARLGRRRATVADKGLPASVAGPADPVHHRLRRRQAVERVAVKPGQRRRTDPMQRAGPLADAGLRQQPAARPAAI